MIICLEKSLEKNKVFLRKWLLNSKNDYMIRDME